VITKQNPSRYRTLPTSHHLAIEQKIDTSLPRKKFKRNASDARDDGLKRLAVAYLLEENPDLRVAIVLIDGSRHTGGDVSTFAIYSCFLLKIVI
jgi:hypothetical protein